DGTFILEELAPGVTQEEVQEKTEGNLKISPNLKTMELD
ncbi:MAG: acyl CoA:acetate/3-ketoacid CoA transferase beta subunit, partial [Urechidicola sp.]